MAEDIIDNSQAIRDYTMKKYGVDYYIYSDTDSIHCLKLPEEELAQLELALGKTDVKGEGIIINLREKTSEELRQDVIRRHVR